MACAPRAAGVLAAVAPVGEQRVPLDHVELDVDADVLQLLLHELVHRQRLHLAGARGADLHPQGQRPLRGVAGLGQQAPRLGLVGADVEGRVAPPGMPGAAPCRPPAAIMPPSSVRSPSRSMREVERAAHPHVAQRRASPRSRAARARHAAARSGVMTMPRERSCGTRVRATAPRSSPPGPTAARRCGHSPRGSAAARCARRLRLLAPIAVVARHLEPLARDEAGHAEGAGARGLAAKAFQAASAFGLRGAAALPLRRAMP